MYRQESKEEKLYAETESLASSLYNQAQTYSSTISRESPAKFQKRELETPEAAWSLQRASRIEWRFARSDRPPPGLDTPWAALRENANGYFVTHYFEMLIGIQHNAKHHRVGQIEITVKENLENTQETSTTWGTESKQIRSSTSQSLIDFTCCCSFFNCFRSSR